eukprot:3744269-Amphidinium_carterae.1
MHPRDPPMALAAIEELGTQVLSQIDAWLSAVSRRYVQGSFINKRFGAPVTPSLHVHSSASSPDARDDWKQQDRVCVVFRKLQAQRVSHVKTPQASKLIKDCDKMDLTQF